MDVDGIDGTEDFCVMFVSRSIFVINHYLK